ncbi:MAG: hypothetical protein KGH56_03015 [Patescibacteria group bacterium]|nr:hypothetical protein [Patescibacteria group bacterium]
MDLQDFKKQYVQEELGITGEFGTILSFIDFGNVNYWFDEDRQTHEHVALAVDEKLYIDLEKTRNFLALFSTSSRFYSTQIPRVA